MKFLIDENLPNAVFAELQEKGFDAIKVSPGAADYEIITRAKKEKRILLTLDKDFADILDYPPAGYYGIVCLRLKRPTAEEIIKRLNWILGRFVEEDFKGKLFIVTETGIRMR